MADGKLTIIDNTRVLAASRTGVKVEAQIHNASEVLPTKYIERFTTKGAPTTCSDTIYLRIGKHPVGYKNRYPDGSVIIGSPD